MPQTAISQLPTTSTASSDEMLVRVEGVSKKFCRSLKKSLWYGRPAEPAVAGCKL